MKSLPYNSYQKVSATNTPVILCTDSSATVSGLPYIDGTVVSADGQVDSRGCQLYIYGITYEETQLIDQILDPVITGLIERNCLTSYIDFRTTASDFYVNVKSFGAVGDGVHDDTVSVQAALDAANAAGGGTVFFPAGTYKITNSLNLYSNITLVGSGASSIIKSGMTLNSLKSLINISGSNPSISTTLTADALKTSRQLTVASSTGFVAGDYIAVERNYGGAINFSMMHRVKSIDSPTLMTLHENIGLPYVSTDPIFKITWINNVTVRDLMFLGTPIDTERTANRYEDNAINVTYGRHISISNCDFVTLGSRGIEISNYSSQCRVSDNRFVKCYDRAVECYDGTSKIIITGNSILGGLYGMSVHGTGQVISDNLILGPHGFDSGGSEVGSGIILNDLYFGTIANNNINGAYENGIYIPSDAYYCNIIGNTINNCTKRGLYVLSCNTLNITGNYFQNNGSVANDSDINLHSGGYTKITDNYFNSTGIASTYAIYNDTALTNLLIGSNYYKGYPGDPTSLNSGTTLVMPLVQGNGPYLSSLGTELVTNGAFTSDLSGWTATGWTQAAAAALHTAGNTNALSQSITVSNGLRYLVSWTTVGPITTANTVVASFDAIPLTSYNSVETGTAGTNYAIYVPSSSAAKTLAFTPTTNFVGSIDNVSVKLIGAASLPLETVNDAVGSELYSIRGSGALHNLGIGKNSFFSNVSGRYNVALGERALDYNVAADGNTAIGYYSLGTNGTGYNNTAVGFNSMLSNVSGFQSTAVGSEALQSMTGGAYNNAFGRAALHDLTTGYSNNAIGVNTLYHNTTGNYNVGVGPNALLANLTGNANVSIGMNTLSAQTNVDENTAVGHTALMANSTGYGQVAVGTQALKANTTGPANTAVGASALTANIGSGSNVAVGYISMQGHISGDRNTTIGARSGVTTTSNNQDNTGSDLTYIGYNTGQSTASANTVTDAIAIGSGATVDASHHAEIGTDTLTQTHLHGSVVAGNLAALATNATDGFLYVPSCAGTPTGVPVAKTGMIPLVVNSTNNKLYFYSGGSWRDAGP